MSRTKSISPNMWADLNSYLSSSQSKSLTCINTIEVLSHNQVWGRMEIQVTDNRPQNTLLKKKDPHKTNSSASRHFFIGCIAQKDNWQETKGGFPYQCDCGIRHHGVLKSQKIIHISALSNMNDQI